MKTLGWLAAIAIAIGAGASGARAQGPGRPLGGVPNPPYSPYLNLLRAGNNPAINYYGLVRPQVDFARSMQALQGQMLNTQQALVDQSTGTDVLITGHAVYFMNYSGYFLNAGSGRSGPAVTATPRMPIGTSNAQPARTAYRR